MVLRPNAIVLVLYGFTRGEKQRTLSIQLSLHGMDTQDTLLNTQDLRSLRCIASNQ